MRVYDERAARERQNLVIVGLVAIIAILIVGWILYANFAKPQGGQVATSPPPATGSSPGTNPSGTTTPSSPGAGPQQTPQNAAPPSVPAPPSQPPPKTSTVLGSVEVTYPGQWTMSTGSNGAAILTDGSASVEIMAADPSSTDAKSAADAALAEKAPNAKITAQGSRTVGGHDAYAYMLSTSSGPVRIVGVDSPTRIVIVESASTGNQFAAHKAAFDKVESSLRYK